MRNNDWYRYQVPRRLATMTDDQHTTNNAPNQGAQGQFHGPVIFNQAGQPITRRCWIGSQSTHCPITPRCPLITDTLRAHRYVCRAHAGPAHYRWGAAGRAGRLLSE